MCSERDFKGTCVKSAKKKTGKGFIRAVFVCILSNSSVKTAQIKPFPVFFFFS
ncbi:hypothetical protein RHMOL_Rhmol04G0174600 [Rhododendron molle]|uniref:Uncharacterized protein n=1 Tax=Rhododendron molle TaxID=49168 RepID=A0ACC0P326_RHOML|nr:hypothetical protein RHMOL_Rhmol04G0174600 [Rhododendron molle]